MPRSAGSLVQVPPVRDLSGVYRSCSAEMSTRPLLGRASLPTSPLRRGGCTDGYRRLKRIIIGCWRDWI